MKSLAVLGSTILVGLGFAAMSCSGSSSSPGASNGGATSSSGGNTSSSGGASSTSGGSKSTTGGSTSTSTLGCKTADTAPSGDLLGDFGGDAGAGDAGGGLAIKGNIAAFGGTTWSLDGDTLTLNQQTAATSSPQYAGGVLNFANCVDAVSFSGVEFTISGNVSGCTLQYSANYSGATGNANNKNGSCTDANCFSPQKSLTVSSSPTQMRIQWEDTGTTGNPVGPVDESKLTGLQWQFTIPAGSGTCSASLSITNVHFF